MRNRTKRGALLLAAGSVLLTACAGTTATSDTPATTTAPVSTTTTAGPASTTTTEEAPLLMIPRNYADYRNQAPACGAQAPAAIQETTFTAPEDLGLAPDPKPVAAMATSCGVITVELDPSAAPETVNSFVFLAEAGYFDGTVSHRIVPQFVIQAGDPTATGLGGPGYVIADEFPENGFLYERGVVAMANAGPGTTGSQFFVVLSDATLPPTFNVLGKVTDGFDVLDRLEAISLAQGSEPVASIPLETVYIESVTIQR